MRSRTWLFFLFLFIFSSCNPRAKKSTSFNSATSLSDETVKFLPPAVDAQNINGGMRLVTMIPGDASHVEITFNGTILKSCSAETLIPEGVATCPVGEESCEIQVKACDDATKECSESLGVTVFMDTESAFPSDVQSVMAAYELEQEQLQLARDLKLEACVAGKELEKYSEANVSAEVLALRDGIDAICKTSDCDILLGFDQFKSDLEDLIAQLALQDILEDEDDDTNDFDEEDTNKLSDTEIALTAVSATLGAALLGGGGTGIYLWRKQARAPGELLAKDLEIKELNEKIINISKQNAELEKNKAQANDADKAKISSLQDLLKRQKEAVFSLKKQRTYLVTAKNNLQTQLENTNTDKVDLEALRSELAGAKNENYQLAEKIGQLEEINKQLLAKDLEIQRLNEELETSKAQNDLDKNRISGLETQLKNEKEAVATLTREKTDLLTANTELQGNLTTLQAQLEAAKTENDELTQRIREIEKIATEKAELEQKITELESKLKEASQVATHLKSKNIVLSFSIGSLKNSDKKNKVKIAALEKQVASNQTTIDELQKGIIEKNGLLAKSAEDNKLLSEQLATKTTELEELRNKQADFDKIAPELATALGDKEKLEEELNTLRDVEGRLTEEQIANEQNKKRIAVLEQQVNTNQATAAQVAAETNELNQLRENVDTKAEQIEDLETKLAEAKKKGTLPKFFMMIQRKRHQAEMQELLKNWKDQVDAMATGFDEQYAMKDEEIKDIKDQFAALQTANQELQKAFEDKDKELKAAQEKTQELEKQLASLPNNVPGNNQKIEKLEAEIKKLRGKEYIIENDRLRNLMANYARKAKSTLVLLLDKIPAEQNKNKDLMIRLASVVKYADEVNGTKDAQDMKIQSFIKDRSKEINSETIKKIGLTSDSTDDFVERVSQFFSTVAAKHAKAYQNNLELEELRANFF